MAPLTINLAPPWKGPGIYVIVRCISYKKMGIFHCHVNLPEGTCDQSLEHHFAPSFGANGRCQASKAVEMSAEDAWGSKGYDMTVNMSDENGTENEGYRCCMYYDIMFVFFVVKEKFTKDDQQFFLSKFFFDFLEAGAK